VVLIHAWLVTVGGVAQSVKVRAVEAIGDRKRDIAGFFNYNENCEMSDGGLPCCEA